MTIQFSSSVRNARLEAFELTTNGQTLDAAGGTGAITGTSAAPKLRLYSGSMPADCATAASGSLLCDITLPADWLAAAASGAKSKAGTWSGTGAAAAGAGTNAGYFRIVNNGATTCHIQGTITATGGGGDMTLDNINIAQNQTVTVNTFTLTDGNA